MSSLIDASELLGHEAQNGECESGIIHFDATQRRKEKMRQKSQEIPAPAEQGPQSAPIKIAPAPAKIETRALAATDSVKKPAANGTATLTGYTMPSSQPAIATALPALSQLSGAELEAFLIDFVVEQTGYPPEMVDLNADLEADLGIDSIKKAQLFGELAEWFAIAVDVTDDSLSLDDFPTLEHVMEFLQSRSAETAKATSAPPVSKNGSEPHSVSKIAKPEANGNGFHPAPKARGCLRSANRSAFGCEFGNVPRGVRGGADRLSARDGGTRCRP